MNFDEFKYKYEQLEVNCYPSHPIKDVMVSICVQTFQHVNYIEDCLNGILNQKTSFNYEILLGDDGSTDGTREICKTYASKYPDIIRLFLHHRENNISIYGKPTGRFNFVYNLHSARGKYIAICEGDDYWTDQDKLQRQLDFLEQNPTYNLVYHNADIELNGQSIGRIYEKEIQPDLSIKDYFKGYFAQTCCAMIRNSAETRSRFLSVPVKQLDDVRLFISAIGPNGMYHYQNLVMAAYRKHEGGIWSLITDVKKIEQQILIDFYKITEFKSYDGVDAVKPKLKKNILKLIWLNTFKLNLKEAMRRKKQYRKVNYTLSFIEQFKLFVQMVKLKFKSTN